MSAVEANPAVTKKFGKGERSIPHSSQRAKKYYPAYDEKQQKKTRKTIRDAKLAKKLEPGQVLILLAGRFRGKRVILLKHLKEGALLVTGPFKINGVPLRRVNHRYVIGTSTKVDLSGVDNSVLERVSGSDYFSREKKSKAQKGEEAYFKQGEKPEAKKPTSERASDQKSVDKPILSAIKKEEFLASYLNSSFSAVQYGPQKIGCIQQMESGCARGRVIDKELEVGGEIAIEYMDTKMTHLDYEFADDLTS